jgi:hypothetical protein
MTPEQATILQYFGMALTAIGWLGIIHTIANIELPPEDSDGL